LCEEYRLLIPSSILIITCCLIFSDVVKHCVQFQRERERERERGERERERERGERKRERGRERGRERERERLLYKGHDSKEGEVRFYNQSSFSSV
jgi:hypothetical protein